MEFYTFYIHDLKTNMRYDSRNLYHTVEEACEHLDVRLKEECAKHTATYSPLSPSTIKALLYRAYDDHTVVYDEIPGEMRFIIMKLMLAC